MYKQRVKDNWGRIVDWFIKANGTLSPEDIPENVEQFAYDMFVKENPEMAEQELQVTIRDRLKYAFE